MANANIKISQLPNIGSNLNSNTLLPVVSTNGTFLTDKVTVGTLANFILDEAGNTLANAFVANIAYSVANAAQPNITSVGNLTGLTITNLSNLHIPGGSDGYFLQTNGAGIINWSAAPGAGSGSPGGSNTEIQFNDSGLFGGNPGLTFDKTTDTLGTVNIQASNATIYDNLYAGNILINDTLEVNNFITNNFTTTGNIEANYFKGDGSQLTGVTATPIAAGPNLSIQFNNDGLTDGNDNFTYDPTTDTVNLNEIYVQTAGNIYENGTALIIRTEPTHIFEVWGNDGATDYKWSFDQDGHLTFPGNGYVRGDVNLIQIYNNSFNQSGVSIFDNFEIAAVGDVKLFTNNDSTPFLWNFDNTGNLTFPDSTIQPTAWTGTIDTGNVTGLGNIAVVNLDGNVSNVLYGDGTFSTGARVVSAPLHSYGNSGDLQGDIAFDGSYFYYCTQNYVDNVTDIWVRVVWTSTNW